ncbi:amidohydrolase [Leucobacter allii]|uniref:amidohydrolase n=1 Tax=Leucobacter allii TaxID=2932247 RepID=UPI001FD4FDFE|nr:amidohydrolase [Leucobacter allii]UOR01389.1 amidohydrolase [Leucobacter allii]
MRVDCIIEHARILTQDEERPASDRLAVLHGRVVALGDDCAGLVAARTVDAGGAVVVPGFNDAHAHSVWFGHTLLETDLSACAGLDELYERIARAAERGRSEPEADPDAWIVASGYNQMDTGGVYPDAAALDRAAGGRPVWIKHTSGHSCIVSGRGMALLGIDGTERFDGGLVVLDDAGRPTGLLEESAMELVQSRLLPASQDRIVAALAAAGAVYAAEGLTSVTDAGIGGGWIGHSAQEFAAYQTALERGLLRTRMQPMLVGDVLRDVPLGAETFRGLPGGLRSGLGDERLQLGPVKMFLDGSILGNTARMSEGYCNHPGNHGYFQGDVEEMRGRALAAARAGWALAMHAVGDEAVGLAIGILRELEAEGVRPPLPHRIEHGGVVTDAQLAELARLGVPIVAQPYFLRAYGDGFRGYIGDARAAASFRLASLVRAGLPVAGSSDRPVAPGRPLAVMQAAVERLTDSGWVYGADERLTAAEALRAYTVGSAEATGWGGRKGRLAPGYLADLAVLSDDPTRVDPGRIGRIEVLATAVGGAPTHDAAGLFGEAAA